MTIKFLADECIHTDIVNALREGGLDILTVSEAGLSGASDESVFEFAIKNKLAILTFDRGFGDIFRFNISKSFGVVIVLIGEFRRRNAPPAILRSVDVIVERGGFKGRLIIIGRSKVRVINR